MLIKNLKNIPLFQNFPRAALVTLSKLISLHEFDDNRVIFKEGTTRDRLYIVLEGRIIIEKTVLRQQEPLAVFKPYDVLGETIIFSPGGKHNHTGKSYAPHTKVAEITIYNLLKLFKQHPQTSHFVHQYFIETLSRRLARSNDKLLTLFATSKLAVNFQNKEHLTESLLNTLLQLFGVKKALIALFDVPSKRILIEDTAGYGRTKIPQVINLLADTVLSKVLINKESVIITPQTWERHFASMPYTTKHMLLVPIKRKKGIIGCLALAEKNNRRDFSLNNEILLAAIAEQVSPSLAELEYEQLERNARALDKTYIDPFYA